MKKQSPIGLYIHVPYCRSKCNYCDFYSLTKGVDPETYAERVVTVLQEFARVYPRKANTVYFGGGTPPMIGVKGLNRILDSARTLFGVEQGEITCEVNPGKGYPVTVKELANMGFNRLSVGLQSANEAELKALGRAHTPEDVLHLLEQAREAGISNCSVDLMWGIPHQTVASALKSVEFALDMKPTHVSAYMLKVEEGTPFGRMGNSLVLPEEDTVCEIYTTCCEALESAGLNRYEISNFAQTGMESKHNSKYWNCEETLGIGPAAHSFIEGKRFYYPRDIQSFMKGEPPLDDGQGGDFTEYAMLQLRLRGGLQHQTCRERFGYSIPTKLLSKAKPFVEYGFMEADENGLRLTLKGNLVSNMILAELL